MCTCYDQGQKVAPPNQSRLTPVGGAGFTWMRVPPVAWGLLTLGAAVILLLSFTSGVARAEVYPIRDHNRLTLLSDPDEGLDEKLAMIRSAQHHIHIMTYYWDDTPVGLEVAFAVREALERGVEVRVLASRIPTRATDPGMKVREMLKEPTADGRTAWIHFVGPVDYPFGVWDNIHEKLLLVDGQAAVIGGRNLSSFIHDARDMELKVEGPLVTDLQAHFKRMFDFCVEGRAALTCGKRQADCYFKWLEETFPSDPVYFNNFSTYSDNHRARLVTHAAPMDMWNTDVKKEERLSQHDDIVEALVSSSFKHLRMYNYFLLHTTRMEDFLSESVTSGKKVEIITNSLESSAYLSEAGYRVALPYAATLPSGPISYYLWRPILPQKYLHLKAAILDDDHAFLGSHNFTTASTSVSSELAIEFWAKPVVAELIQHFEKDKVNRCTPVDRAYFQEQLLSQTSLDGFKEKLLKPLIEYIY